MSKSGSILAKIIHKGEDEVTRDFQYVQKSIKYIRSELGERNRLS